MPPSDPRERALPATGEHPDGRKRALPAMGGWRGGWEPALPAMGGWWASALRLATAAYWLYFAAQKWPPRGVDWMEGLIRSNPAHEPIPGVQQVLQYVVAPNWHFFAVLQSTAETAVGVLLVLGVATRLV